MPPVTVERHDAVLSITLDRPERRNAIDTTMRDALFEAFTLAGTDPKIGAVVVSGTGPVFCSGADLAEFGTAPPPLQARDVRYARDLWGLLARQPAILIAALHGAVLGAGLELALLCDLRLAAADAVFGLPETRLGMIPAAGGTQTLPRAIRPALARELLVRGRRLDARAALDAGLVSEIVPATELLDRSFTIAARVAADPAMRHRKQLLREALQAAPQGRDW